MITKISIISSVGIHVYLEQTQWDLLAIKHHFWWEYPGLQIRVRIGILFSLFLIQNIWCGYSKEPSQWDGPPEHPKHIFKLMGKKIKSLRK